MSITKDQVGISTAGGCKTRKPLKILEPTELFWQWLIFHKVTKAEVDVQSTTELQDMHKQRNLKLMVL